MSGGKSANYGQVRRERNWRKTFVGYFNEVCPVIALYDPSVRRQTVFKASGKSLGGASEHLAALGAPEAPEKYRKQLLQWM